MAFIVYRNSIKYNYTIKNKEVFYCILKNISTFVYSY